MKNINELNVVKCAHCKGKNIISIDLGVKAVHYQCKECGKHFCKEYK